MRPEFQLIVDWTFVLAEAVVAIGVWLWLRREIGVAGSPAKLKPWADAVGLFLFLFVLENATGWLAPQIVGLITDVLIFAAISVLMIRELPLLLRPVGLFLLALNCLFEATDVSFWHRLSGVMGEFVSRHLFELRTDTGIAWVLVLIPIFVKWMRLSSARTVFPNSPDDGAENSTN